MQSFKTKIKGDQHIPEFLRPWNAAEFFFCFRVPLVMSSSRCPFRSTRSPSAPSTPVRCCLRLTLRLPTPRAQSSWPAMKGWRRSSARSTPCARRSRACASRWERRKARPAPARTSTSANQIWKMVWHHGYSVIDTFNGQRWGILHSNHYDCFIQASTGLIQIKAAPGTLLEFTVTSLPVERRACIPAKQWRM